MMRFLADENVSRLVIQRIQAGGYDIVSVGEAISGASDKDVLDKAGAEDRILITEDRDLGELVIRQRLKVRGVILLELDRLSNPAEAEAVADVISAHPEKLSGNLVVIEPGRIRVRPLLPARSSG
jgi:predicted nuclease of predicted toxin-antitoxin system